MRSLLIAGFIWLLSALTATWFITREAGSIFRSNSEILERNTASYQSLEVRNSQLDERERLLNEREFLINELMQAKLLKSVTHR